jgi:hypothetical protein
MVIASCIFRCSRMLLFGAQQAGDAVFERLDPPRRAAVIMALLGLTLIGLFLVTFVMVGGHWVRRLARHRPGQRPFRKNVASESQLSDVLQNMLPAHKTGDTVLLDTPSKETRIDT